MIKNIKIIAEAVLQIHKLNGKQLLDIVVEITDNCHDISKEKQEALMFGVHAVLYNRYESGDKTVPFVDGPPRMINYPNAFPLERNKK
ncbi:MAG: hypothetical protein PVG39_00530 [Desulfobacteraceae bacterium]|jgi:hypothetical protein